MSERSGPILLYELNEVPWRVVDWYVARRPKSALADLLPRCETWTTVTHDVGELHPWVTWPTLHRSVYNTTHGIAFINQDLSQASAYPPLWEQIAGAGKSVGVFGSLQSYPPPASGPYAFYVPDTFAPGPETLPARYECFQRLNLRQTQADRGAARDVTVDGGTARDVATLLHNGLTLKTAFRLCAQLAAEKKNPLHRWRRPILQAPVAFDVFRHALAHSAPDFCTFFTNHVAGIMHRYWKYAFPEDFGYTLSGERDAFHADNLLVAMDYADEQIAYVRSWVDERGGRLYIASSMGQEAIAREEEDEVYIEHMDRFIRGIGFEGCVKPLMAMHPDYSFALPDAAATERFAGALRTLERQDGQPAVFRVEISGLTVSAALGSGSGFGIAGDEGFLHVARGGARERVPFSALGLAWMRRDVGTGYHQPYGTLLRYGRGVAPDPERRTIESVEVAPMILRDLGLSAAGRPISIREQQPAREHEADLVPS